MKFSSSVLISMVLSFIGVTTRECFQTCLESCSEGVCSGKCIQDESTAFASQTCSNTDDVCIWVLVESSDSVEVTTPAGCLLDFQTFSSDVGPFLFTSGFNILTCEGDFCNIPSVQDCSSTLDASCENIAFNNVELTTGNVVLDVDDCLLVEGNVEEIPSNCFDIQDDAAKSECITAEGVALVNCTGVPTSSPSSAPIPAPTTAPSSTPTDAPVTFAPTSAPSASPSAAPSTAPTGVPTAVPTISPTFGAPTSAPSVSPTSSPTVPTASPTQNPTFVRKSDDPDNTTIFIIVGVVAGLLILFIGGFMTFLLTARTRSGKRRPPRNGGEEGAIIQNSIRILEEKKKVEELRQSQKKKEEEARKSQKKNAKKTLSMDKSAGVTDLRSPTASMKEMDPKFASNLDIKKKPSMPPIDKDRMPSVLGGNVENDFRYSAATQATSLTQETEDPEEKRRKHDSKLSI